MRDRFKVSTRARIRRTEIIKRGVTDDDADLSGDEDNRKARAAGTISLPPDRKEITITKIKTIEFSTRF